MTDLCHSSSASEPLSRTMHACCGKGVIPCQDLKRVADGLQHPCLAPLHHLRLKILLISSVGLLAAVICRGQSPDVAPFGRPSFISIVSH